MARGFSLVSRCVIENAAEAFGNQKLHVDCAIVLGFARLSNTRGESCLDSPQKTLSQNAKINILWSMPISHSIIGKNQVVSFGRIIWRV